MLFLSWTILFTIKDLNNIRPHTLRHSYATHLFHMAFSCTFAAMKNKNHEQNNEKVCTACNLVFRNQMDQFIPPGF